MPVAAPSPSSVEPPPATSLPPEGAGTVPLWRCGVILFLAVVMLAVARFHPSLSIPQQSGVVMSLPNSVYVSLPTKSNAQFYGSTKSITEGELGILPSDTELVRKAYDDIPDHESIICTLLLSGAEQRSIHRPEVCLVGQGWTVIDQENLPIQLTSGHDLVVRKLTIQRDIVSQNGDHHLVRAFYIYWFVGENLTTPSHFMRVFLSSWDRVVHQRAHRWAYIMVMSPVSETIRPDGLNAAQTQTMMTNFIRQVVPSFQKSEMPVQASP